MVFNYFNHLYCLKKLGKQKLYVYLILVGESFPLIIVKQLFAIA